MGNELKNIGGRAKVFKKLVTTTALVTLLALGGCEGKTDFTTEQRIDRAVEFKIAGNLGAAVIELKNVLRQSPDNTTARYLLGELYVAVGDGKSAEKELDYARTNGVEDSKILPLLAEAWLLQREFEKVQENVVVDAELPLSVQLTLKALKGEAALGVGDVITAENLYQEVLAQAPRSVHALVGMGYVNLRRQHIDEAKSYLARASEGFESHEKVLKLRGELNRELGNLDEAEAAFQALVDKRPGSLFYRSYLAWVQSQNKKYDLAEKHIDMVLSVSERNPIANHIKAAVNYHQQDFETARNHADIAFNERDTQWGSALLGGAAAYALGEYEQAYSYLTKYVAAYPGDVAGRKLYAKVQIRLGQIDQALSGLESVLRDNETDPELLSLIAQTALQKGDLNKGRDFLEKTRLSAPDNAMVVAQLGRTQYEMGDKAAGIDTLQEAVRMDPTSYVKQLVLLESYIRSNMLDEGIVLAQEIQQSFADKPEPVLMEGVALAAKKEQAAAIEKFNEALQIAPGHPDASRYLMTYAAADEKWDEVRSLLENVIEHFPQDIRSYLELYRLEQQQGREDNLTSILERCLANNPDVMAANYLLARHYVAHDEYARALPLGRKVIEMAPVNPAGYEIVGLAELNAGQVANAVNSFTRLTELAPDRSMSHFYLAEAYEALRDWGRVVNNIRRGLRLEPANVNAQLMLSRAYALTGEEGKALAILEQVERKNVSVWYIDEVYADIAFNKQDYSMAADSYRAIFVAQEDVRVLRKLAVSEMRQGDTKEVVSELESWRASHPQDFLTGLTLGAVYLQDEDYTKARDLYAALLQAQPENITVLNNLTGLQTQLGETAEAWENARKLAKKAPTNAVALDTAAAAALGAGKVEEAVRLSTTALEASIEPDARILFNHAKALLANGDEVTGREMLRKAALLKQGQESASAQQLLDELEK